MKNHQYSQFFWHMSVSGVFLVHVTVPTLTPLNLLLKSARTAHPVLNAFSTVFILTSTVISIHSSIWLEGGWWMTCATFGDTLPQKGQRYDKELGTIIRKIHSLHSSFLISQTTIVVFKINSSFIFFQNYYLTISKLLE